MSENSILKALIDDFDFRKSTLRADRNQYTTFLKEEDSRKIILLSFAHIVKGVERKASLVDLATTIGRRVRQKLRLSRNSIAACQVGWFILISFFEVGLINYTLTKTNKKGKTSKHRSYNVDVKNKKALFDLWEELNNVEEIDLFPSNEPTPPWKGPFHPLGYSIIKKSTPEITNKFNLEQHAMLFQVLNKLGSTPWMINKPMLEVIEFYMDYPEEGNPLKFKQEKDHEKRESLFIEISSIQRLAKKNVNKLFYHLYNFDFRGRIYPNTAFLHEQSSDNAKSLLLFAKGEPIGEEGFYWMLVHGSNTWGNDKVSLDDRAEFCLNNYDEFLAYADCPFENTGWMQADKPFSFLAFCKELRLLQSWVDAGNEQEEFVSHLPLFIDGSNNGSQHLTAMSKDEELAPYVNLVPSEIPGDLYALVAEKVWKRLERLEMKVPSYVYNQLDYVLDEAEKLQKEYDEAPAGSERKALAYTAVQTWRNNNRKLREALYPVYWNRIKELKVRRKITKRPTMTSAYGAVPYGMGQQVWDDTRTINEYLGKQEKLWASMLGRELHAACYEDLQGPGALLKLFEEVAEVYNEKHEYMAWNSPITNFPVVQNYRKATSDRTLLSYGGEKLHVVVENWEDATLDKDSQKLGASPNIVHSLDAVHMTMVVNAADYPVAAIHDSWGTTAGNMSSLFKLVREKFVELYKEDPLKQILTQLGCENKIPKRGKLNINKVLESDFCFC
jgi:DNA-directed RNA polymerase